MIRNGSRYDPTTLLQITSLLLTSQLGPGQIKDDHKQSQRLRESLQKNQQDVAREVLQYFNSYQDPDIPPPFDPTYRKSRQWPLKHSVPFFLGGDDVCLPQAQ